MQMEDKIRIKKVHLTALIKESLQEIVQDGLKEDVAGSDPWYQKGFQDGAKGDDQDELIAAGRKGGTAKKTYEKGYTEGLKSWLAKQPKKDRSAPSMEE